MRTWAACAWHLQIPPTQDQYSSTTSYNCPSPGEHNLKGRPNCILISCIIFDKSLTIIYTVSKNSSPPVFCTQWGSALYLVSHRKIISTNIRLLRPVFTIQGYIPSPAVQFFHFQDGGVVTYWSAKAFQWPHHRAKYWQQKSANPVPFPRMSTGSTPRDGCW